MTSPADPDRRAQLVGTGLIGGSIGMALRTRGWHVTGSDADPVRANRARDLGAVDAIGVDQDAAVTFVATPVGAVAAEVLAALRCTRGAVTDVGSVKAPIMGMVGDPRFVGGHPMAGSEQEGIDGADPELFSGAVWVLTPVEGTDPAAHSLVRSTVSSLGAEVVELAPERHDALVAVVSHVPHLAAATLMRLAADSAEEQGALLRLAAGGFRDMTRVAAGHPGIWPDICAENRRAIVEALDRYGVALREMRDHVDQADRGALLTALEAARAARTNLPSPAVMPTEVAELRVPVPDRPGVLADVTTLATDLDVNIVDLEIAHSAEGQAGVLILLVEASLAERLRGGLLARGYRPSVRVLG